MNDKSEINYNLVFDKYFENFEVKPEFNKEYVSLWNGWLGAENYHKLDEVTEDEWEKLNILVREVSKKYEMFSVNLTEKTISKIDNIETTLASYNESMNKNSSEFSVYLIPQLDCILTEDWDFTSIIWYKNKNSIKKLNPIIKRCQLFHFA